MLTVILTETADTGGIKCEGNTPIRAAEEFVHTPCTDIARKAPALARVKKWATAAIGLAPVCTAAVAWLQQARDYSPCKEAEENVLAKQLAKTGKRAQELEYELAQTKGLHVAEYCKDGAGSEEAVCCSRKRCCATQGDKIGAFS